MKKYLRLPSFGRFCLYPALALSFAFLAMTAYADDDRKYIPVSDYNRLLIQDRMILAATVGFLCLLLGGIIVMDWNGRNFIINTQPVYDRNHKIRYLLKSVIDITDINRQKLELQKAMEQALAADRAKSYFLATMKHAGAKWVMCSKSSPLPGILVRR